MLILFYFMYDAILGGTDKRVQGGHLLIPFLAERRGAAVNADLNLSSMPSRIRESLQTR